MRLRYILICALLVLSCERRLSKNPKVESPEGSQISVILEVPRGRDSALQLLWQRSYPEEYLNLVKQSAESKENLDPFAEAITVPDDELTPGSFGLLGWDRALVSSVFDELGYPLKDGAEASYDYDLNCLSIRHSASAIESFRLLFPEFKPKTSEQGVPPKPDRAGG